MAVQASNDTNTDVDRAELMEEYENLKDEIMRIILDKDYNTMKVFGLLPARWRRTLDGKIK